MTRSTSTILEHTEGGETGVEGLELLSPNARSSDRAGISDGGSALAMDCRFPISNKIISHLDILT